jgi:hypothetical protein
MSIRPPCSPRTRNSKTGHGKMRDDDPRLLTIAAAAQRLGGEPAAREFGISRSLVRRAMRIHGVLPRPIGWHLRSKS